MTRKAIRGWFIGGVAYFAVLVAIGLLISACDHTDKRLLFGTFKDLIPLLIAIPVVWLGYCFQRRAAFLQQLRSLWSKLVDAVQTALQYTECDEPSQQEYAYALLKLRIAIDEVRGLFKNLHETGTKDELYPFEPLKDIYGLISDLGCATRFNRQKAEGVRRKTFALWKDARRELLKEFDREEPTFSHSHWADLSQSGVYNTHGIPKRPT